MLSRLLFLLLSVALVILVNGPHLWGGEQTHECTVVQAGDGKMTVMDRGGNLKSAAVAKDAKITLDGKECKLTDLKSGLKVKLTVRKDGGQPVITGVEGTTK